MNQRSRFIRKIIYACVIAALLLPLSWLSQPATTESQGGVLAQMREENQLSQATLGEIDPASETIKLATLGLRGVAANVLWEKANDYKKREDWTSLSATLEQIAKLQPNFISVWIYQGWNLSYNISVEFDDYHDRYYWVIKGVDFLKEGTKYNTREPRLMSEIGMTIAQKIGKADEHVQFRRLFREDDDFNGSLPRSQRDNWLVGRQWLVDAEKMVDQEGVPIRGKSPLLFHSHAPMCLINYCEALEEEGTFGEVARNAWRRAAESWEQFSNRDLPTQYNMFVRLADKERYDDMAKQARAELEKLTPAGLVDQIKLEKIAALDKPQREAYNAAPDERTDEQRQLVFMIEDSLKVKPQEIADRIQGENHAAAVRAAEDAANAEFIAHAIDNERDIVNYGYWQRRCQIEPQDDTLEARKKIYDADQAFLDADLGKARQLYDEGMVKWRSVLDANTVMLTDPSLVDELSSSIDRYRAVLHQLDEPFPPTFILRDVLEKQQSYTGRPLPPSLQAPPENKPAEGKPAEGSAPAEPAPAEKPATETPSAEKPSTES